MFKVGDKTVHPKHGVAVITAIETKELGTGKQAFFVLQLVDSTLGDRAEKLMVPVEAAEAVLRSVISKKDVDKVLAVLKEKKIPQASQPWNRRRREYSDMLHSGSPIEVAKVLRDLTLLKNYKDLSQGERDLLGKAKSRLVSELALAKRCKEDRVEAEIHGILAV